MTVCYLRDARDPVFGLGALELELDVLVEPFEALVAEQLESCRAEQPLQGVVVWVLVHDRSALHRVERDALLGEIDAQLSARVVKRLVERAAARGELLCQHVERHAVERERD